LLMIFSIQAARTIRRWCGHPDARHVVAV
jgi:hypothetical protein